MGRVEGKVAIVTGGGSGLGKADCILLAAEGATVVVSDVNEEAAKAVADSIGGKAIALRHDVASELDWQQIVSKVERHFGRLDILVNNAGIVLVANPEETTLDQFRLVNSINSEGVFLGCKYAIPLMRKSGGGSIINVSSIASHLGYPTFFAYCAAKGAVRSMTKSIAMHCQAEGNGVRCNSVHPGTIETPMMELVEGRVGQPRQVADGPLPAGVLGAAVDIANLVLFLASDESRFITGSEMVIDNGALIAP